jgi:hypothetical protein
MDNAELVRKIHEYINENFSDPLNRCQEFLRQKSISATGEGIKETDRIVHNPDEYMTVEGLRDFEKFVVTFLYKLSE